MAITSIEQVISNYLHGIAKLIGQSAQLEGQYFFLISEFSRHKEETHTLEYLDFRILPDLPHNFLLSCLPIVEINLPRYSDNIRINRWQSVTPNRQQT